MERGALVLVFPRIWLLICKFHLRQSWKNHRCKVLKGKSPEQTDLKQRLHRLEDSLIATVSISEARNLISSEMHVLIEMKSPIAAKAIEHLTYLDSYWTTDALWHCWSDYGRKIASGLLKCPFEGVLPTTNHLESFNGVLKRKHLAQWQNGGHRVRLDLLVMLLVTRILPSIFLQRKLQQQEDLRFEAQLRKLRGGQKLAEAQKGVNTEVFAPMAYFLPDERRDSDSLRMLNEQRVSMPTVQEGVGYVFEVFSSMATAFDKRMLSYCVLLAFDSRSSCKCKDFTKHGGACKHMRSCVTKLDRLRHQGYHLPPIITPTSLDQARSLQQHHLSQLLTYPLHPEQPQQPTSAPTPIQIAAACVDETVAGNDAFVRSAEEESADRDKDIEEGDDDEDADEFDFSVIRDSSIAKDALDAQKTARVLFELERAAPKLGQLGDILKGAVMGKSDIPRTTAFVEQLETLTIQLKRMIVNAQPPSKSENVVANSFIGQIDTLLSTPPRNTKRSSGAIMGPSPEKAQKRHKSFGVH